jgi:hypothetical protein
MVWSNGVERYPIACRRYRANDLFPSPLDSSSHVGASGSVMPSIFENIRRHKWDENYSLTESRSPSLTPAREEPLSEQK